MKIQSVNNSTIKCDEAAIVSVAKYSLKKMGIHPDSELGIRFVNEDEMTDLHIKWMNLPGPTDVLSFPMDEVKPNSSANGPAVIGDIVLCPAFAEKNGKQSLAQELELLTVHGVLHLIGHEHDSFKKYKKMNLLEQKIIRTI